MTTVGFFVLKSHPFRRVRWLIVWISQVGSRSLFRLEISLFWCRIVIQKICSKWWGSSRGFRSGQGRQGVMKSSRPKLQHQSLGHPDLNPILLKIWIDLEANIELYWAIKDYKAIDGWFGHNLAGPGFRSFGRMRAPADEPATSQARFVACFWFPCLFQQMIRETDQQHSDQFNYQQYQQLI